MPPTAWGPRAPTTDCQTARPMPKRPLDSPRALERRQQLIDAGFEFFADGDYDDVQIDEIADAIGISHGLIFQHFGSKKGYYLAIVGHTLEEFRARTTPDVTLPAEEQFVAGLGAYVAWVTEHPRGFVTLMQATSRFREIREMVEQARWEGIERIARSTGVNLEAPRVRLALRGWIGGMESAMAQWVLDTCAATPDELVDHITGTLLDALRWATGRPTPRHGGP